jgi:uncharacterized LabA/DUF88 family protein
MAENRLRVRVYIDFWNFQLGWNEATRTATGPVQIPWRGLPQILATEAAKGQAAKFAGAHVYASVNVAATKDRNLNKWLHHTLASYTGYSVDVRERKPRPRAIRCQEDNCKASISNCPSCHAPFRSAGEKGVDAAIITDLIASAFDDNYDVGVLISGDADLAPAVRYIQKKTDKQIVQAYFKSHGDELRNACWDHIFFEDLMSKLVITSATTPTLTPATPTVPPLKQPTTTG